MGKRGIRFIPSSIVGLTRSEIAVSCVNRLFFLNLGFFFFFLVMLIIIVMIMIMFVMFM